MTRTLLVATAVSLMATATELGAQAAFPSSRPSPPVAAGVGECNAWYPAAAKKAELQGVTVLDVHFLIDGTVKNASVVRSSGNTDLDNAAVTCLEDQRFEPVKRRGEPVEVEWQRAVVWRSHERSSIIVPRLPSKPARCSAPMFHTHGTVTTTVSFEIGTDGIPEEPRVLESSGNSGLDQFGLDCVVRSWRFPTALENGKPIEVDWIATLGWGL